MARNESLDGRRVCRDVESTDTAGRKPRLPHGRGLLKGSAGACVEAASAENAACAPYPSNGVNYDPKVFSDFPETLPTCARPESN